MVKQMLQEKFAAMFNRSGERLFFAPGRLNLIGEHTDYNGGHVFPCAITQGTYGLVAPREDKTVRVYSLNFEEAGIMQFNLDDLIYREEDVWANFVKGMILYMKEFGFKITHGFDLLVYGDIPNGAGLSSSASLELLVGVMMDELYDLKAERLDLVKLGKEVENDYIGVNSGIMDQFAIGMAQKNYAIFLNTNTLAYELVPADFGDYIILIMNTNKRRELANSKYNTRKAECEEALTKLQTELSIASLGELTSGEFEKNQHLINDDILVKRAKHAVSENERTLEAKDALLEGDLSSFGQLLNQSHISLRDDYDVTGIELDILVEAAWEQPGVLGARMTGAGMGGCAIALVERIRVDEVIEELQNTYTQKIGYPASFYIAEVGGGAKELAL